MAKFNVEVDLDWLDDETTIDEEIRERVIKGAEDYLLQTILLSQHHKQLQQLIHLTHLLRH